MPTHLDSLSAFQFLSFKSELKQINFILSTQSDQGVSLVCLFLSLLEEIFSGNHPFLSFQLLTSALNPVFKLTISPFMS